MSHLTRRDLVAGAAIASATASGYAQVAGANERMRIGVIGCGAQGTAHMRSLVRMRESDNLQVVHVCDAFTKRVGKRQTATCAKRFGEKFEFAPTRGAQTVGIGDQRATAQAHRRQDKIEGAAADPGEAARDVLEGRAGRLHGAMMTANSGPCQGGA